MSPFAPSRRRALLRMLAALAMLTLACDAWAKPRVLGWLEWAWLEPDHIRLKAKLDTGARTSSIDADEIELFERDGEQWVRFRVPLSERPDDSTYDKDVHYELPLAGRKKIKDHVLEPARRYVVEMELCIGGRMFTTPMTLADRSRFNYPLLLGRAALQGRMMVDPAQKYTADRSCPKPATARTTKPADASP
ncbi:MAG: ATP-dependent zinc protease [Gammaproteobacteria bacterium]